MLILQMADAVITPLGLCSFYQWKARNQSCLKNIEGHKEQIWFIVSYWTLPFAILSTWNMVVFQSPNLAGCRFLGHTAKSAFQDSTCSVRLGRCSVVILMSFCLCVIFHFLKQQIKQMSVSSGETFYTLLRLHFEMLSVASFIWFVELDGELRCLDLLLI